MFQPNESGTNQVPPISHTPAQDPEREKARIIVYGSLRVCDRVIKSLHTLRYAEPNDWSGPIPTGRPGEWMRILTKTLLIE
ncbi:MAG TPA: hypothetical protein V6D29_21145 [Leptolyngbyaceae cyanobacterium]